MAYKFEKLEVWQLALEYTMIPLFNIGWLSAVSSQISAVGRLRS